MLFPNSRLSLWCLGIISFQIVGDSNGEPHGFYSNEHIDVYNDGPNYGNIHSYSRSSEEDLIKPKFNQNTNVPSTSHEQEDVEISIRITDGIPGANLVSWITGTGTNGQGTKPRPPPGTGTTGQVTKPRPPPGTGTNGQVTKPRPPPGTGTNGQVTKPRPPPGTGTNGQLTKPGPKPRPPPGTGTNGQVTKPGPKPTSTVTGVNGGCKPMTTITRIVNQKSGHCLMSNPSGNGVGSAPCKPQEQGQMWKVEVITNGMSGQGSKTPTRDTESDDTKEYSHHEHEDLPYVDDTIDETVGVWTIEHDANNQEQLVETDGVWSKEQDANDQEQLAETDAEWTIEHDANNQGEFDETDGEATIEHDANNQGEFDETDGVWSNEHDANNQGHF